MNKIHTTGVKVIKDSHPWSCC